MITTREAMMALGQKAVYRAPHVPDDQPGEEGVITRANASGTFVRYGRDTGAKLTPNDRLTLVSKPKAWADKPTASTHFPCPDAPYSDPFATHHLEPVGVQGILACTYCGDSDAAIRDAAGL